jgi:hypothetical protein
MAGTVAARGVSDSVCAKSAEPRIGGRCSEAEARVILATFDLIRQRDDVVQQNFETG